MKKIIFLGRKDGALKAIKYLIDKKIKLAAIVGDRNDFVSNKLHDLARANRTPFLLDDESLYDLIKNNDKQIKNIDLVISYLYPKKIKLPLINLAKLGCINLHPAPLPDYKSSAGYNMAILDGRKEYGVSAHFIDSEEFDSGPIIKVLKFNIAEDDHMMYLYQKTQEKLFELFKDIIQLFQSGQEIRTIRNEGGLYLNRKQIEKLKEIDIKKDNLETINRKIRAFFFPPYAGAKINIKGQDFTLVNNEMLKYLDNILRKD